MIDDTFQQRVQTKFIAFRLMLKFKEQSVHFRTFAIVPILSYPIC